MPKGNKNISLNKYVSELKKAAEDAGFCVTQNVGTLEFVGQSGERFVNFSINAPKVNTAEALAKVYEQYKDQGISPPADSLVADLI